MYKSLSKKAEEAIIRERAAGAFYGTPDCAAVREEDNPFDRPTVFRSAFVRDIGKIINLPLYSRMSDKTQVLSMYRNDDISRRMLHVQLVSRIARDISRALLLNEDLTEAIALGHDLGHTPFGHAGERMLNKIMHERYGIYFNHNVQSVRALTAIHPRNLTIQTLDGILCHNGESPSKKYTPSSSTPDIAERVALCEKEGESEIKKLVPSTIEGCVVRIADIIAYLGKDRQDAINMNIIHKSDFDYGFSNSKIINDLSIDIIEHSYAAKGKYLSMSDEAFDTIEKGKQENYKKIYLGEAVNKVYEQVEPMMVELFDALLSDVKKGGSFTRKCYIDRVAGFNAAYRKEKPERIVCDFIASMTDDFFIAAYKKLTGKSNPLKYKDYFDI